MTLLRFLPLVFSLALPLAAQTELPITTPTRDPAVGDQISPRAASLGGRGLIVWGEQPTYGGPSIPSSLRAARIGGDGKLLDQDALILDTFNGPPRYDVAASGDRFVVAYGDPLRVRTVGRDGALGDPVTLGTSGGSSLRIAVSNDGSRFLVAWFQGGFKGALLDGSLHVLATDVDLGAFASDYPFFALVPHGNGFALIARSSDAGIVARTLDANANVTGDQTLATDIPAYASINAAASGDDVSIITGPILIEWSTAGISISRGFSGSDLLGVGASAVVSRGSSGLSVYDLSSPFSPPATVEVRLPHEALEAAVIRLTDGIYTAFTTVDGFGQTDLFGALNSGPIDIIAGSPSYQTAPAIASDAAGESLVVWREYSTRARVWQLLARIVDGSGVPTGAVTTIASNVPPERWSLSISTPHVASDGARFLVTWGVNTIQGQFVAGTGKSIGDPFVITESALTYLNYLGANDVTWNGQRYLVTWVEGIAARLVTDAHAVGAFVGNDGNVGTSFRITDQTAYYAQASSPGGDTLLASFTGDGFASYILHSDGTIVGPYLAVAPGASVPVVAWSGSAFIAAWSAGGKLQTGLIQTDGSTTVLPLTDFTLSPTRMSGNLVMGLTADGIAEVQLDPAGHPMGGPVLVAPGAASPTVSEAGVIAYTRAGDRDITRIFVQRPASVIRHRAVAR